ncbi:hypothetical protein MHTCC0001_16640 [Flavobacteriaceae bacterium MHTCC 0001]
MESKKSKLGIEKFSIHKLNNASMVTGGGDPDKTDRLKHVKSTVKCMLK